MCCSIISCRCHALREAAPRKVALLGCALGAQSPGMMFNAPACDQGPLPRPRAGRPSPAPSAPAPPALWRAAGARHMQAPQLQGHPQRQDLQAVSRVIKGKEVSMLNRNRIIPECLHKYMIECKDQVKQVRERLVCLDLACVQWSCQRQDSSAVRNGTLQHALHGAAGGSPQQQRSHLHG